MKKNISVYKFIILLAFTLSATVVRAQQLEWRLTNPTYNAADPDGVGAATSSVTFTLQIHTTAGVIPDVSAISTGFSWQSANAMLPTGSPCGTASSSQPANITMGPAFAAAGFTYNAVNECSGTPNFTAGGQTFNRRSAGTVDNGLIVLTTTWTDVFTVTLWSLGNTQPQAGYAVINSSSGAVNSPAGIVFGTYAVSDVPGNEYPATSLTYGTPLPLGAGVVPVSFSSFDISCTGNGALVKWSTANEVNSRSFELQKSADGGRTWNTIESVNAAGQSTTTQNYQKVDTKGGDVYYRIKQVDNNGQFTYSDIKRSACTKAGQTVSIYPVPAKDILNVIISSDQSVKTTLQVYDANGKNVRSQPATIVNGSNKVQIDLRGLATGQYFIRSSNPDIILSEKFSIVNN